MLDTTLQKLASTCLKLGQKTFTSSIDGSIGQALAKFTTLNNEYQIEHEMCNILRLEEGDHFFKKRNGKVDNFTILAQLRHLENKASISNAQHEKCQRDRVKRDSVNKSHARTKKNWKKIESCLKEPYLVVYNNFTQNKQEDIFDQSYMPEVQSEEDKSFPEDESAKKLFNFSKELRSYKKIIQFTKEKLKIKQQYQSMSPVSDRKAQSLDELRSASKNRSVYKDYVETAKKFELARQKKKIKVQGFASAQQVVNRKLSRIFKKVDSRHNLEELKNQEHTANLMKKQSEIIRNSSKFHPKNENFKKIKSKFAEIVVEMSRGVKKRTRPDRRISQSLDLKRKQQTPIQSRLE